MTRDEYRQALIAELQTEAARLNDFQRGCIDREGAVHPGDIARGLAETDANGTPKSPLASAFLEAYIREREANQPLRRPAAEMGAFSSATGPFVCSLPGDRHAAKIAL